MLDGKNFFILWIRQVLTFKDKRLILKLYINEKAVIKGEYDTYEEAKVQKGVTQGCNL